MSSTPVCRVQISEDAEAECWDVICMGDGTQGSFNMAVEAFEWAFNHYQNVQHQGRMFVDVIPQGLGVGL